MPRRKSAHQLRAAAIDSYLIFLPTSAARLIMREGRLSAPADLALRIAHLLLKVSGRPRLISRAGAS